ncbi:hypothetical protein [Clostridium tetani]|uniref:hypothetical protein n=1 Tax=Clostridium tetani TaxID=1513 RepID=UPI00100ACE49|nr:hypothetical protein [Clostridium tetani]RXM58670.1 hypothetical protein DP133_03260 [Clostridium tetani]RXM79459.1 hypothetical protein DP154_01225 [Clostridium tetani]RYV00271.1 hypothetical protein DP144_01225 [Clostridium tetani]
MKTIKMIVLVFVPIPLLYLLNILMFNKYPEFLACFCSSCTYVPTISKINSFEKLLNNFLDKENKALSKKDLMNLVLVFVLTILLTSSIHILQNTFINTFDLGYSFWGASIIFQIMSWLKIPKRFFN